MFSYISIFYVNILYILIWLFINFWKIIETLINYGN